MTEKAKRRKTAVPAKTVEPEKTRGNQLQVPMQEGKSRARLEAEVTLSPVVANAFTAKTYARGIFADDIDLMESINVAKEKVQKVRDGDMTGVEATLVAQAETLDAIFNSLAVRAAKNMGQHMGATESYLRLAFKAQTQCRATLETLAEIKNPSRPTFIKQQNLAHNQQVNNGVPNNESSTHAHARERNINPANELLETSNGERLDFGTAQAAGGANPELATVGTVNRPKKRGR